MTDIEPFTSDVGSEADFGLLDDVIAAAQPMLDAVPVDGPSMSAVEAQRALKKNFFTLVLATVMCGGWNLTWSASVVNLIAMCQRTCSYLLLFAVEGGRACQAEIKFILRLLPKLGFEQTFEYPTASYEYTIWQRERVGGHPPYKVTLSVYKKVEYILGSVPQNGVEADLQCTEHNSSAPNLTRCAVVSAPVKDAMGENINEKLNAALLEALDKTTSRAARLGFPPRFVKSDVDPVKYQQWKDYWKI